MTQSEKFPFGVKKYICSGIDLEAQHLGVEISALVYPLPM